MSALPEGQARDKGGFSLALRAGRPKPAGLAALALFALSACSALPTPAVSAPPQVRTGMAALEGYASDAPGVWRLITPADLPEPYHTPGARNPSQLVPQPEGARPLTLPGFEVNVFAADLKGPRRMRVAPNGDVFVTESLAGRVTVLKAAEGSAEAGTRAVYLEGLNRPFGLAFHPADNPEWLYVANTDSVVRYPYRPGDLAPSGPPEIIIPKMPTGGHATRDLAFSLDGSKMYVSVGSGSNIAATMPELPIAEAMAWGEARGLGAAWGPEEGRAEVWVSTPEGGDVRAFATGIRNCSGLSVNHVDGNLWCSTNERDMLGDDLVPDYSTRVRSGQHFGWPWHYIGGNEDPRLAGQRPDLKDKVAIPDVLYQSHSAPLQMIFYTPSSGEAAFPSEFHDQGFVTLHGSWNRQPRTGYKVVRVELKDGVPTGAYQDFMVGLVTAEGQVWGRPVGIVQARGGALLVSDDGGNVIWRIAYSGDRKSK